MLPFTYGESQQGSRSKQLGEALRRVRALLCELDLGHGCSSIGLDEEYATALAREPKVRMQGRARYPASRRTVETDAC